MNLNKFIRIAGCCSALMSVAAAAWAQSPSGCISNQGSAVLNANATLVVEIGGIKPCTQFNEYNFGQTLTINGAKLQIVLANNFTPAAGQSFPILSWASESGAFGNIDTSQAVLPAGLSWDFSGLYGASGGVAAVSASVAISQVLVPVPAWALLTLASVLPALSVMAGRRKKPDA